MKLCRTCRYGSEYELDKPCVVYREDCPLYEKRGDEMTNEALVDAIEDLPSVNPQQKTGFWCGYDKNDITLWNWWDINTCSICGNGGKHYNKFRYCPNCGAKMESGDKG